MTESLSAQNPGRLVFDKDGDVDPQTITDLIDAIRDGALTDIALFSHGWNNDEAAATSLYQRWFGLLAAQVDANRPIGYVGIRWPAELWRDEPIPNFDPGAGAGHPGVAAVDETTRMVEASSPAIDPAQLADLKDMFPEGSEQLDTIARLLAGSPAPGRARELMNAMREFNSAIGVKSSDGETKASKQPGMLDKKRDPDAVFGDFADGLADAGVEVDGGGKAIFGDVGSRILNGAKEALRQLTYWQMKNRAGVVGQKGLGPVIDRLASEFPGLHVHLIGHSFGARVVSFALAGMSEAAPSTVKSITLLQGAYSRFAFGHGLPFGGDGALDGKQGRVDGPLTVCFSSHDSALSVFYPLASAAADDDKSAIGDPLAQFRAMGQLGAFNSESRTLGSVGTSYPFNAGQILNLDASDVVVAGDSPSGAHSDIFHPELAWVVAAAGGLKTP
jgi:hypothetical protein